MSNDRLIELRKEIDGVDEQMIQLFARRMEIADRIALVKRENNLSLVDTAREEIVVKKAIDTISSEFCGEAAAFMRSLMDITKSRQRSKLSGDGNV